MTNPFKYGRIVDSTIIHLIVALVLVLPFTISFCSRSSSELLQERHALLRAGTLETDSLGTGTVALAKGDSVTLLGVVEHNSTNRPWYWVETDRGYRGYLPQECLSDSAIVVYNSVNFKKDTTSFKARHTGDTIVVSSMTINKHGYVTESAVRLADGKDTVVKGDPFTYTLAEAHADHTIDRYGDNMEPMSAGRFEGLCIGKKFADVERDVRPALIVTPAKGGGLEAQYPVLVFKGGKFYRPIVEYGPDSIATGYRLPGRASRDMNSWLLKFIPFYGTFCDLPMVGNMWNNGVYEASGVPVSAETIRSLDLNGFSLKTVWAFVLFIALVVFITMRALLVPMFIPYLCYGLLRFPPVFKRVSNGAMHSILIFGTLALVTLWVLITLSNYYILLTVIGEYFVVKWFFKRVDKVLQSRCPEVRCSLCKTLYSTEFTDRVEEGERRNAIEEVEEVLDSVTTSVERWQTYDEVTTTYNDGSKKTHKENIQNHSREHGYNVIGVFMETVEYIPYTLYYTCAECGGQEKAHETERRVLSRQKLREYKSHF